jgi:exosortase
MSTLLRFFKSHPKEFSISILLLIAYMPIILWMWERWFAPESYYGHGVLIPMVSIFLIFMKREELKKLPYEPSGWSFRILILGIFLYWTSAIIHIFFSAAFSMILVISGLVLHFYGKKSLRHILFPLLFLVFMIPLPLILVAAISFKLKLLAAQLATTILNNIRLPALQEASLIRMRHSYVVVEDACGGLRSLISLTALGAVFAYQIRGRLIKKIFLFISAIPIAVVTNAFRIVFLATVGEIWGTQYTQGFLHNLSGYLVFTFAFLLLFYVEQLLE